MHFQRIGFLKSEKGYSKIENEGLFIDDHDYNFQNQLFRTKDIFKVVNIIKNNWNELKDHIKQNTKSNLPIIAIGSGGNINKIFSLSKKKEGKPLSLDLLKDYYKELSAVSLEDRIKLYKLREDRADVIVPALQIYINIMRWAEITEIYVPKIGLADGLIQSLYEEVK